MLTLLIAVAVLTLAGFTQGLTGFGFGLVSMSLLPFVLPVKDATTVLAPLNVITCATTLYAVRRHLRWRRSLPLVAGSGVGIPLGVFALVQLDAGVLIRALGAFMVLFALVDLAGSKRWRIRLPAASAFPVGVVSGSLGGAFNAGGPPLIAYTYAQPWTKEEIIATLQLVFGVSALLRLALLGQQGLMHAGLWQIAAWAVVPMFAGITVGNRLLARVPREPLRAGVSCVLLVIGLKYLVAP
jgi:uncharacterized membrane protein YfcA